MRSATLNPASATVVTGAVVEPSLAGSGIGETVSSRLGYFCADRIRRPSTWCSTGR
jgi:hypothetical protein